MRISRITISEFGGIAGETSIDLDADVVIVVGANGYGKTTLCDAVAWVISGSIAGTQSPRNLYSDTATTSVEMQVTLDNTDVTLKRSLENPAVSNLEQLSAPLVITVEDQTLRGAEAEAWLRNRLAGVDTNEDFRDLARSFVDSIYLRQESLREFLTGREDTERFDAIASMVGAGRLREFSDRIQTDKRAWVAANNQADAALEKDRAKMEDLATALESLVTEISHAETAEVVDAWRDWLQQVQALDLDVSVDDKGSDLTSQTLVKWHRTLNGARSESEQTESKLLAVQAELLVPLPSAPNEEAQVDLDAKVSQLTSEVTAIDNEVERLRMELTTAEKSLRVAASLREDMANMASILLRHTSDKCAACGQTVDEEQHRARLEAFVSASEDIGAREVATAQREQLVDAQQRFRDLSQRLADLTDQQRSFEEQRASATAARVHREVRLVGVLKELTDKVPSQDVTLEQGLEQIEEELRRITERKEHYARLLETAKIFDAHASRDALRVRYKQLLTEQVELADSLSERERGIYQRRRTSEVAGELLTAVRSYADIFVDKRLAELQPLLSQFYAAIDPHPTFRSIEITTRQFRGKHRLTPVLRDDLANVKVTGPGETLSTSQANALAVSLFLAFNLGFSPTHSKALILDDPLQNLDDVHLLGLVDLLRKVMPARQLIVTTHDYAFASLLARKLRPVSRATRTTYVQFTKWDRNGPGIRQWDLPSETKPLKIVAT